MRILHLAYEDPMAPGSGGGSIRTHEVNRRLASRHELVAVVASYPGARARIAEGVHWAPIGPRVGRRLASLAYFALAPATPTRWKPDLVVEDLSAPFGPAFSPLFFRPVVASVQWLFARQMREKYHLPFDAIERAGLRLYDDFIAVSDYLADDLRRRRPDAMIETIPNGVDVSLFDVAETTPRHLLYVGRIDIAQKGLDLLLEIVCRVAAQLGDRTPRVVIAGNGPDGVAFARRAAQRGLSDIIEVRGRVEGDEKRELLSRAHAVLMPSRFETFGMVAVEAQAVGVPLVAFDVGPLREVTGSEGVVLARPFDVESFASATIDVVRDAALRHELGSRGRRWARRYDWDEIAMRQEAHYERALQRHRQGSST